MSVRDLKRSRSALRVLLGLGEPRALNERVLHPTLVATYRLRVVAVGALITAVALINLFVNMLLNGHEMSTDGFMFTLSLGLVLLAGLVLTPWNRVLVSKSAMHWLYLWSTLGIVTVGVGVYFDGGGTSALYTMFPVLIVFFGISYPRRAQALLFALIVVVYLTAVAGRGWNLSASATYLRLVAFVSMGYVASILSSWLMAEMRSRAKSLSTAEQRAGMLDTVARAARRVSSLDVSHILGGALSGAMELGCFEAEVWLLEADPPELKLQRRIAIDMTSPNAALANDLFGRARASGTTQIVEQATNRLVACLLHREGDVVGLLLVKMTESDSADSLMIECMELLAAQVSTGLDVARNVAERRGLEERLAHWAFHDSLTDLPNRVLFADRLELALARTARDASQVAVLFLDLDGFKEINDTLGHAVGDELLHSVAERLHSCLRPNDTLARYGGDEFVVLVEQVEDPRFATLVAQRILDALQVPVNVAGHDLLVRTSIGIALAGARPGADTDVLRRADIAMYEAKAAGGSRYELSPGSDSPADVASESETPAPATEEAS